MEESLNLTCPFSSLFRASVLGHHPHLPFHPAGLHPPPPVVLPGECPLCCPTCPLTPAEPQEGHSDTFPRFPVGVMPGNSKTHPKSFSPCQLFPALGMGKGIYNQLSRFLEKGSRIFLLEKQQDCGWHWVFAEGKTQTQRCGQHQDEEQELGNPQVEIGNPLQHFLNHFPVQIPAR